MITSTPYITSSTPSAAAPSPASRLGTSVREAFHALAVALGCARPHPRPLDALRVIVANPDATPLNILEEGCHRLDRTLVDDALALLPSDLSEADLFFIDTTLGRTLRSIQREFATTSAHWGVLYPPMTHLEQFREIRGRIHSHFHPYWHTPSEEAAH